MSRPEINIVWLKRDLRSQDHEPLAAAEAAGIPYLILYLFEPTLLAHPQCSLRHNQFIFESLQDLKKTLGVQGRTLNICYADAVVVFSEILQKYSIKKLFSYRESGVQLSWDRDKEVAQLCLQNNIEWLEFQREGVLRGIQNRDGWDKAWFVKMHSPLINNSFDPDLTLDWKHKFQIPETLKQAWSAYPAAYQAPGETMGWKYLKSFCEERGRNYMRQISKPLGSRYSCGRVSPYLAWGCLSVKQVYQYVKNHPNAANNKRAFNGFLTRVKWRSHFIQKFEVECEYETLCINRGYEHMDWQRNETFIKAWKSGQTGYPMVDANMRCLQATGWINFRMRAMLVSFFCHHLGQDWRDGVYHLAQLFLDYEPGIHYPQFQMQAGTTGVNTVRMYNPVKQGLDHDPDGEFIKQWVPELREVPTTHIHQPWTLTPMEQQFMNFELGVDYPLPLVDLESSGKAARQRIYGHRKHPQVQKEKQRILKTHTRRIK